MLTFKYMCAYHCMNLIKIINTLSLALEKDFSSTIGCNMNSHISNANK